MGLIRALALCFIFAGGIVASADDAISYWVGQLGSEQYLRRESASDRLVDFGTDAIDPLIESMRAGDLEVVERSVDVITRIAMSGHPSDDGGAFDKLSTIATHSTGLASSRAASAIDEIGQQRATQARTELAAAGIFIGIDDFVIRTISITRPIVQIDEEWNGDLKSLEWLKWVREIENARIVGDAINADVINAVSAMPKLKSIALVDGQVDDVAIDALTKMQPILSLEFRYVKVADAMAEKIAAMPIRVSLNLMGTGISADAVELIEKAAPGLQVDFKQGGFLGVTCQETFNTCAITGVLAGSAAEKAGLIAGDDIVQVDDIPVAKFSDLQDAISLHLPGDVVKLKYRRGPQILETELKLGRYTER